MGNKKDKKNKDNKKNKEKVAAKEVASTSRLSAADHLRIEKQINKIINHFNYEKVQKVMTYLNWEWFNPGGEKWSVPTIERLISASRFLLTQAATAKESTWSTGGFIARRYEGGALGLTFYIDDIVELNPDNKEEDDDEC